jgi:hypothetical protein
VPSGEPSWSFRLGQLGASGLAHRVGQGTLTLTGAGKASLLWGLVRAMSPVMHDGLVRVLAADPKLMDLAFGRIIFDTHGPCWTF